MKLNPVLGRMENRHYPKNFHDGPEKLKSKYKLDNELIEGMMHEKRNMNFKDVLKVHMERINREEFVDELDQRKVDIEKAQAKMHMRTQN